MGVLDKIGEALSASHDWFDGFDRDVCYGRTEDTEGKCPKLEEGTVAQCGVCWCTISGLDTADTVPTECVRREKHNGD
jgi:hypothetical protein